MFPLLTCPDCGGLLSILSGSMTVVTSKSGAMTLIAPLAAHSCDSTPWKSSDEGAAYDKWLAEQEATP